MEEKLVWWNTDCWHSL